jgi:plastocyanin
MMRRGAVLAALLVLAMAAPASPHGGHGPVPVDIANFKFTPSAVTLVQGDSIIWTWRGPDTNHSVTADSGQSMTFDSDPGRTPAHPPGDGYAVTFNDVGTFTYHCKVHASMTGTVTVQAPPAPVTAAPPQLTKVSVAPRHFHRSTTVRYTVDGPVTLRALLRKGRKLVKEIDFNAPPGPGKHKLTFRKIKPGKYVLRLVAVDTSSGKSSKPVSIGVVVT